MMSAPSRPRFQNRRGRPDRDGPPPHRPGEIDEAILYGAHPVIEALRNPRRRFRKLLATENALKRLAEEVGELPLVPELVRPSQIDRLLTPDAVHQGLYLVCDPCPRPTSTACRTMRSCWRSTRSPIRTMSGRSCARPRPSPWPL
jgi:23S rRNA (guanosine2251-2'-O)-methyltransferase